MRVPVAFVLLLAGCHGGSNTPHDAAGSDAVSSIDAPAPMDAGVDAALYPANAPPIGECANAWCWVYPLPQGYDLYGIYGTSATDVWAFGYDTILHYDGSQWTKHPFSGTCGSVQGAAQFWSSAANDIWVAGVCGGMHWDGTAWSGVPLQGTIGGLASNDLWTGGVGTTSHWDGVQWTSYVGPTSTWRPIAFGGSAGTTITISNAGGIAQWLGTGWGIADAGTHAANAAVVLDATHAVIAQNAGAISIWSAGTWTTQTAPVSVDWKFITATSTSDVWVAAGLYGVSYVYHWDGITWTSAAATDLRAPTGIWRDPTGALWSSTIGATVRVWNGSTWTSKTVGDNFINAVNGSGWDNIWIASVGYGNRIFRWQGTAWEDAAFPYPSDNGTGTGYTTSAIWANASDDVWIVGGHALDTNTIQRTLFHWNGSAWSTLGPYGNEDYNVSPGFVAIWGAAANDIYALGSTALYHYDGASWNLISGPTGGTAVFGSAGNDVYVVKGTALWHWDGSMWTMKAMPASQTFGWANSPTDVWLDTYHYDGTFFVAYPGTGRPIGTASDMYTVGGTVSEWVGGLGGTKTTGPGLVGAGSVWKTADGHIFAAARGLVVH